MMLTGEGGGGDVSERVTVRLCLEDVRDLTLAGDAARLHYDSPSTLGQHSERRVVPNAWPGKLSRDGTCVHIDDPKLNVTLPSSW